ncbi:MAG: hypothetical protein GY815_20155, partial [Gammaproteobacteria bacterium]|nr:hypothetical protein [Gammaproteobacteria bacterium]
FAGSVSAHAPIESELDMILNADRGAVFAVQDSDGQTVGALTRDVVVELLAAPQRKA